MILQIKYPKIHLVKRAKLRTVINIKYYTYVVFRLAFNLKSHSQLTVKLAISYLFYNLVSLSKIPQLETVKL